MTQENKKFNFDLLAKPIGNIETSQGTVNLYAPSTSDFDLYTSLIKEPTESRAQRLLIAITSMEARTSFTEDVIPIPLEVFSKLSENELSEIVDVFHTKFNLSRIDQHNENGNNFEPRKQGEAALVFFDRILNAEVTRMKNHMINQQKLIDDALNNSVTTIFEQLNKSTARLNDTLGSYDRFVDEQKQEIKTLRVHKPDYLNGVFEQQRRLDRERSEDRELAKITGQMTAQSAELLKELAISAENFLVRLDAKDEKNDKQVNFQLWLGVGSLIITAVLALLSLVVSVEAFKQDANEINASANKQLLQEQKEKDLHQLINRQSEKINQLMQQQSEVNAAINSLKEQPKADKKH